MHPGRSPAIYVLLVQAVAGVILVVAGILAWGATGNAGPAWIPTFAGALFGGFIFASAVLTGRRVRASTSVKHRVRQTPLYIGVAASYLLTAFALLLSLFVGDAESYERRTVQGPVDQGRGEAMSLEPRGFVVVMVLICIPGPVSWLVYGSHRFLGEAFDPVSSEVEGLDPMGQIMGSA